MLIRELIMPIEATAGGDAGDVLYSLIQIKFDSLHLLGAAQHTNTLCKQTTAVSTNVRRSLPAHVLTRFVQKASHVSARAHPTQVLRGRPPSGRQERYTLHPMEPFQVHPPLILTSPHLTLPSQAQA